MPFVLRSRLSALFLFQYLATGSWFVTLGTYMSKSLGFDDIIGSAYGMIGLATILSALFAGMLADRFFATERLLAVLMLFGGLSLFWLSTIHNSRAAFLAVMFLHSIFYSGVRDSSFWILIVAVLVMVIPKKFYDSFFNNYLVEKSVSFHFGGISVEPTAIQTLGQVVEMVTLLLLPLLVARLGIKRVMIIGMLGWIGRFLLWAYGFKGDQGIMPMILLGIMMHGVSYDFFFVSAQIWLDTRFPAVTRARVQAFYWFILSGLGVVLGSNIAGIVYSHLTLSSTEHGWTLIWLTPAIVTLVMLVIFARFFRERPCEPFEDAVARS
jgi:MFS family permease